MEIGDKRNKDETEKQAEQWKRTIIEQGAVGVSSLFPHGEVTIGGIIIKNSGRGEDETWRVTPIYNSQNLSFLTQDDWDSATGLISFDKRYFYDSSRLEKTDILYITDLQDLAWLASISSTHRNQDHLANLAKGFAGIQYESFTTDKSRKRVSRIVILPLGLAKEFAKDAEKDPMLLVKATETLLSGIDHAIPRDKPDQIILTARIRGQQRFPFSTTKIHKIFKMNQQV